MATTNSPGLNACNFPARRCFSPPTKLRSRGMTPSAAPRMSSLQIAVSTLLANDQDPDGDRLTIASVGSATHGSVSLSADHQTATFIPDKDYNGPAQFTYQVEDVHLQRYECSRAEHDRRWHSGRGYWAQDRDRYRQPDNSGYQRHSGGQRAGDRCGHRGRGGCHSRCPGQGLGCR